MKNATVYLSILTPGKDKAEATFNAIKNASGPIQAQLGRDLTGKFCPHLHFEQDDTTRKTLETLRLIDQAQQEYHEHPLVKEPDDPDDSDDADETQQ
jgi:ribosome-binding factor A